MKLIFLIINDTIRQDQVNGILHEKSDIIKFLKKQKIYFDMVKKLNGRAIDQHSSKEKNIIKLVGFQIN